MIKNAVTQYRPLSNRFSVALLTLFVVSIAVFAGAGAPVESPADLSIESANCSDHKEARPRFFVSY